MELGRLCGSCAGEGGFSSLKLYDLYLKTMVVGGCRLCGSKNFFGNVTFTSWFVLFLSLRFVVQEGAKMEVARSRKKKTTACTLKKTRKKNKLRGRKGKMETAV